MAPACTRLHLLNRHIRTVSSRIKVRLFAAFRATLEHRRAGGVYRTLQ